MDDYERCEYQAGGPDHCQAPVNTMRKDLSGMSYELLCLDHALLRDRERLAKLHQMAAHNRRHTDRYGVH